MSRLPKIIIVVIVLAGIGGAFGYGLGFRKGLVYSSYLQVLEQQHYQAFAKAQSEMGTNEAKSEAIKQFISITEKRQSSFSPTFTKKTYAVDLLLSYARLAQLAESGSSPEEAKKYLQQAESYCPETGWQECSIEVIKQYSEKVNAIGKSQ